MVTAPPLPQLITSDGTIEPVSLRLLQFIRALQAVEHILAESDAGHVAIHYCKSRNEMTVVPAPSIKVKAA